MVKRRKATITVTEKGSNVNVRVDWDPPLREGEVGQRETAVHAMLVGLRKAISPDGDEVED